MLARWKYFKDLLTPITTIPLPSIAQEVHLGEENTLTAAEVYPAVEALEAARCNVFQS